MRVLKTKFVGEGRYTVAELEGELDIESSSSFGEECFDRITNGQANMMIDLSKVGYIDSSGLGVLISIQKSARMNGGSLVLVGMSQQVKNTMRMTHLDDFFEIYERKEEVFE